MKKIAIINGPNLNRLGKRDPEIYGPESWEDTAEALRREFPDLVITDAQTNSEGTFIDLLQAQADEEDVIGIIINPGAYAHYSLAIADAISDLAIPTVEVHISNIMAREDFRSRSVTGARCRAIISGAGRRGYALAIRLLAES